ncbi:MAG: metal ABC transporter ATP-binding protein [Anaerolineae bacterium]|nr:metal ABC transporter ATP-binding protein [Anaerolineae bacterium]MDW8099189.1 metal ABC transporter ATP-binding protein [Anaerolineae bacterium]
MSSQVQGSGLEGELAQLEVEHLTVAYNGPPVLLDVTFQVPHGARVAVVGPNGAGKSTLFKALVGLLPLRQGRVRVHGRPLGSHLDCVAYVPQREEVDWRFPVTVADVVMMGRYGRLGWFRRPRPEDHEIVRRSLEQMGLAHLRDRPIGELSGGQQQRVFLARALAQEPHILLMDEPFTGVDAATQEAMLALLDQLHARGVTVMVSTHDLNLAATRFDRILLLNRRVIAYGTASEVFTPQSVLEAFSGQALILPGALVIDQCCPPGESERGRNLSTAQARSQWRNG